MFFRNSPQAIDARETDRIGPHEVIAYIEAHKEVAPEVDRRITDHHGQIMADDAHLHEVWAETGKMEIDLDNARVYQYHGALDKTGRLVSN